VTKEEDDEDRPEVWDPTNSAFLVPTLRGIVSVLSIVKTCLKQPGEWRTCFLFLKGAKQMIPNAAFLLMEWMVLAYKHDLLALGGDYVTIQDIVTTFSEHYDMETGRLDVGSIIQHAVDDAIDDFCYETTGVNFSEIASNNMPDISLFLDVPAVGEFLRWLGMSTNPMTWQWLSAGFGPHLLIDINNWIEDAAGYIMQKDVLGSGILTDIVELFVPWSIPAVELIRATQEMVDGLASYNDFAHHYNEMRFQLLLELEHDRNDIVSNLSNLIDLTQLANYIAEQGSELGIDVASVVEGITSVLEDVMSHIEENVDEALSALITALDAFPQLPELRADIAEMVADVNLTFSLFDINTWEGTTPWELAEGIQLLWEAWTSGDIFEPYRLPTSIPDSDSDAEPTWDPRPPIPPPGGEPKVPPP
jgi:hypothetical protein